MSPTPFTGATCSHDQGLAQPGNYADNNAPVSYGAKTFTYWNSA
jgi:hypothetical protein